LTGIKAAKNLQRAEAAMAVAAAATTAAATTKMRTNIKQRVK
jgi:hypothetical protein